MKQFRKLIKESQDQIDGCVSLLETAEQNKVQVTNNFIKYLILNEKYDTNWADVEEGVNSVEVSLGVDDFIVYLTIEGHWADGIQNDECFNPNECEFIYDYVDFDIILDSDGEEIELTEEVELLINNTFKA